MHILVPGPLSFEALSPVACTCSRAARARPRAVSTHVPTTPLTGFSHACVHRPFARTPEKHKAARRPRSTAPHYPQTGHTSLTTISATLARPTHGQEPCNLHTADVTVTHRASLYQMRPPCSVVPCKHAQCVIVIALNEQPHASAASHFAPPPSRRMTLGPLHVDR